MRKRPSTYRLGRLSACGTSCFRLERLCALRMCVLPSFCLLPARTSVVTRAMNSVDPAGEPAVESAGESTGKVPEATKCSAGFKVVQRCIDSAGTRKRAALERTKLSVAERVAHNKRGSSQRMHLVPVIWLSRKEADSQKIESIRVFDQFIHVHFSRTAPDVQEVDSRKVESIRVFDQLVLFRFLPFRPRPAVFCDCQSSKRSRISSKFSAGSQVALSSSYPFH